MHVVIAIETCRNMLSPVRPRHKCTCLYVQILLPRALPSWLNGHPHGQKISGYNNYTERDGGFNAWSLTTMKWL